jgi:hypothetical protein
MIAIDKHSSLLFKSVSVNQFGHAPALLTNIRLGCKGVPMTNALTYYSKV